jgi:hypothetical protein
MGLSKERFPDFPMTESKTDRADYRFTVKEYGDGTPWIMFELRRAPDLPVLGDGFLGLDLRPGTSFEEAKRVASFLNDHVECVAATSFQHSREPLARG